MKDIDIFEGKNLSTLLKEIHDNAISKRKSINAIIELLTGMIRTADDAVVLAPILREFLDVGVKNDDQIIKVATIVQRITSAESYGGSVSDTILSEAEKEQLLRNALDVEEQMNEINAKIESSKSGQNS